MIVELNNLLNIVQDMHESVDNFINEILSSDTNLFCIVGKNGSGKTLTLKKARLKLFDEVPENTYIPFLDVPNVQVILEKERRAGNRNYTLIQEFYQLTNDEFEKIEQQINHSLQEFNSNLSIYFKENTGKEGKGTVLNLHYKYSDSSHEHELSNASSGLKIILTIISNIEISYYLSKIKQNRFFVFIDEPECNLHPEWQKQLLNYFQEKINNAEGNLSILYSTHSSHMIPVSLGQSIRVAKYEDRQVKLDTLWSLNSENRYEISVLDPIEEALGVKFSLLDAPFVTVEGEQEIQLLNFLYSKLSDTLPPKITNIQGASKLSPFLLLVNKLKSDSDTDFLFVLDCDLEKKDFASIERAEELIEKFKNRFVFIGKELYEYTDIIDANGKLTPHNECLEDFLITKILIETDELTAYNNALSVAKTIFSREVPGFSDHAENYVRCAQGIFGSDLKFKPIISCFRKLIEKKELPISRLRWKDVEDKYKSKLLEMVIDKLKANPNLINNFTDLINKIKEINR